MSIARLVKILVVVFVLLAGMNVTFALLASQSYDRKEFASQQRVSLIQAVADFQTASADLTRWARAYSVTGNRQEYYAFWHEVDVEQRRENAVTVFESYNAPQSELDLIQRVFDLDNVLAELDDLAFEAVAEGHLGIAIQIIYGEDYEAARLPITLTLDQLSRTVEARTQQELNEANASASMFETLALVSTVLFGLLSVLSIVIILRKISPISQLIELVGDVSQGKVNANINSANLSNDEIGILTRDVYGLVEIIKNIVKDLSDVRQIYRVQGNSKHRLDPDKYQNSFRDMIISVNTMFDEETANIKKVVKNLNRISAGDFDIQIDDQHGDWQAQPEAFRALIADLKSVSTEVSAMINAAAVKGELSYKIDVSKYEGGWKEIMKGLNGIAKAVNLPITEIMGVMNNLSQGDFSNTVNGNYKGDFMQIKNAVNTTINILSGYITEITDSLSRVSNGDLTHSIKRDYVGSFSDIKDSLNNISASLNKTMSEIVSASAQVLSGARQISNSASELANGAQEQASSVEELNATIDVLSQQTRQNADNAIEANQLSDKSTANAREGNNSMKEMLMAMAQIKESSNDISKIIKVIEEIAFQTNLLALNAAVEAARAGEHGKGFSVVAEEVRSLAGRSQTSASETTSLIQDSIGRVESGSGIAEATSLSLDTIVKNAGEVSELISNISAASKDQAEAIAQVSEGLSQISKVVQSNSAVSQQTAATSEQLNSQAELLQQLVAYFKL